MISRTANGARPPHWVTQSQAARLETAAGRPVVQSNISRFLDANRDVPVQRGPDGKVRLVNYDALALARRQSLSVQDKLAGRDASHSLSGQDGNSTSRKRSADAEWAEMDIADRKSRLISREAAALARNKAVAIFGQALESRRVVAARRLAGLNDVRLVELELKAIDRAMLTAIAADLAACCPGRSVLTSPTPPHHSDLLGSAEPR